MAWLYEQNAYVLQVIIKFTQSIMSMYEHLSFKISPCSLCNTQPRVVMKCKCQNMHLSILMLEFKKTFNII